MTGADIGVRRPFAPWNPERAEEIARSLSAVAGPCLPVLHALQEEFGYVNREAIPIVADVLNISRAEVVGVVSFYHDLRDEPPARHVVRVCRAEACQSMGGERLHEALAAAYINAAGAVRDVAIESVYCLGNCALSPAAMIDGQLIGRVTPERVATLVEGSPS